MFLIAHLEQDIGAEWPIRLLWHISVISPSPTLSLSLTHTHTHTYTLSLPFSLSLFPSHTSSLSISLSFYLHTHKHNTRTYSADFPFLFQTVIPSYFTSNQKHLTCRKRAKYHGHTLLYNNLPFCQSFTLINKAFFLKDVCTLTILLLIFLIEFPKS